MKSMIFVLLGLLSPAIGQATMCDLRFERNGDVMLVDASGSPMQEEASTSLDGALRVYAHFKEAGTCDKARTLECRVEGTQLFRDTDRIGNVGYYSDLSRIFISPAHANQALQALMQARFCR